MEIEFENSSVKAGWCVSSRRETPSCLFSASMPSEVRCMLTGSPYSNKGSTSPGDLRSCHSVSYTQGWLEDVAGGKFRTQIVVQSILLGSQCSGKILSLWNVRKGHGVWEKATKPRLQTQAGVGGQARTYSHTAFYRGQCAYMIIRNFLYVSTSLAFELQHAWELLESLL